MIDGINLTIYKNGEYRGKDITQLVQSVKWAGRRGSPARTLIFSLIDDDGYHHERSGIDVEEGWQCIFRYNDKELFRGIIMSQSTNHRKLAEYKAYDNGIYLSNNRDTFVYANTTAAGVFCDVCTRFGIPFGDVAGCSYLIPDLTKKKTTGWDAIQDAMSLEYEATGNRYFVISEGGTLHFRKRQQNILQWVLDVDTNISQYSYSKSIENVKTRQKLLSDENLSYALAWKPALEMKIGIMQDVDTLDKNLDLAQIILKIIPMLMEKERPKKTISLSNVLGKPDVVSGVGVFVSIPHIDINRTLYVDSDTHLFKDNLHTMTVQLSYAADIA